MCIVSGLGLRLDLLYGYTVGKVTVLVRFKVQG